MRHVGVSTGSSAQVNSDDLRPRGPYTDNSSDISPFGRIVDSDRTSNNISSLETQTVSAVSTSDEVETEEPMPNLELLPRLAKGRERYYMVVFHAPEVVSDATIDLR